MTYLQELAENLKGIYGARFDLQKRLAHLEADLEARKLALVPTGGWLSEKEKATVDQRKAAAEVAYSKDDVCLNISGLISQTRDLLSEQQALIDGLQELASAERWRIRELLAYAMRGMDVPEEKTTQDDPTTPAMDNHADELVQSIADTTVGAVDDPVSPDLPKPNISDGSDIPF
jgi:hypothetical protein